MVSAEPEGIIGKVVKDDQSIIYSFDKQLPSKEVIASFPTVVVIQWAYDGSKNKGMPSASELELIYQLEDVLDDLAEQGAAFRAYARTGNNTREFVYYIIGKSGYLELLNQALSQHPEYPIDISFYSDPDWSKYKELLANFKQDE